MFKFFFMISLGVTLLFGLDITESSSPSDPFKIGHFYDESGTLTIDQVQQQRFQKIDNAFSFGYIDGTSWFEITLTNTTNASAFVLEFNEPLWKELTLYRPLEGGGFEILRAGLLTPLDQRAIESINPSFPLQLTHNQTMTLYVKGSSNSAQLGKFTLYTQEEFTRPTRLTLHDIYRFFIFFLFIILVFNLYLFIAKHEKLYLIYITYIISLILWFNVKSGLYLCFGFEGWDEGLHATGAMFVTLLTLFSQEFFQLKKRFGQINHIFTLFAVVFFILTLAIAANVPFTPLIFNIISSLFFTLLFVTAILVWKDGHLDMPYYIIALVIFMPTMGMLTLTYNGLIAYHSISRYAFLFGSFSEVIFFNSLMISHYHIIFKDRIRLQKELIALKTEKESQLEEQLRQRVEELEASNQQLKEQTIELEEVQKKLEVQATTDPLTGLYNRRYVHSITSRVFDTAKRYEQNLSVIMLDIDDFKRINDAYGHAMGDDVIEHCAQLLKKSTRQADIVARFGGEEFLIIIPNTPHDEVIEMATRIEYAVAHNVIPYGNDEHIHCTFSIGITHLTQLDNDMEQLIQRADKAMYRAKSKGKNCIESL